MTAVAVALADMGEPDELVRTVADGRVYITSGSRLLFCFDEDDVEMRNLVIAALRDARVTGVAVGALFGFTDRHVSAIRTRVQREGSQALVRRAGRPPKLTAAQIGKARRWKAEGVTGAAIAIRLGVSDATISRVTADVAVVVALFPAAAAAPDDLVEAGPDDLVEAGPDDLVEAGPDDLVDAAAPVGVVSCRYAGAMLMHAFWAQIDAEAVLGAGRTGRDRYGPRDVAVAALFGLVLGGGSIEAIKHLSRPDLGALAGTARAPGLQTLRRRLARLADSTDAVAQQRRLAAAMLALDPAPEQVFYVDDHFVPYYGARPVAKGWNTKRRHAMPGWDDSFVCDAGGRILAFTSAEPSGLSVTMRAVLPALPAAPGATGPAMIGFDRGGSYPTAFTWLDEHGFEWLTWRRGPLTVPAVAPTRTWCQIDGTRHHFVVADETVALASSYGPARQITLYEHGEPVVQILTSNTTITAARLISRLRSRWRIENAFKYLSAHHGIDQLCDYRMDLIDDTRPVAHPDRRALTATLNATRAEHAEIERQLGAAVAGPTHDAARHRRLADERYELADDIDDLDQQRRALPAKIPANQATPGAQRALPRLERRSYQMVLRVLAYNADLWLARRLDTYLNNPDEVRAITRHLFHQPGTITYTPTTITVTITAPDQPATARALTHLCDELNHTTPAHIPGDPRPITYQTAPT